MKALKRTLEFQRSTFVEQEKVEVREEVNDVTEKSRKYLRGEWLESSAHSEVRNG